VTKQLSSLVRAVGALGLLAAGLTTAATTSAAQTLTMSAGAESSGGDVQLNEFAPTQIAVTVGDTVTWKLNSTEFHNILFLGGAPAPEFVLAGPEGVFVNPAAAFPVGGPSYDGSGQAGSGLLNKGDSWSLTFSKAGSYTYLCAIHAGMGGTVNVVPPGQTADTQAAVDARTTSQVNSELAVKAVPAIMSNVGALQVEGAVAGIAGGVQNGLADIQRFLPQRVTIHQGEALTWVWKTTDTPHTVTFLGGQKAPDVVMPVPQPNGPPKLQLNPAMLAPAGNATQWDGGSYLNSGFLQPMPGQPAPTFTVRFDAPGSYDYVCLLHEGMVGTIVVTE
jgi:plastocyanin